MKDKIILIGGAGSGKTHLKEMFIEMGKSAEVSYTTRSPREGEIEGVDYHFIDEEKFEDMIANYEFMQYQKFRGWYYGTSRSEFDEKDVFIMNIDGLSSLMPEDRIRSLVIYLDIDEKVRKERLMIRNDPADSVDRRLKADKLQLEGYTSFDIIVYDENFTMELVEGYIQMYTNLGW